MARKTSEAVDSTLDETKKEVDLEVGPTTRSISPAASMSTCRDASSMLEAASVAVAVSSVGVAIWDVAPDRTEADKITD